MIWFDVDGARAYLAQGEGATPSRKLVYRMVANGLRVARTGNGGKGDRLFFCPEWIDEFLLSKAVQRSAPAGKAEALLKTRNDGVGNGKFNEVRPTDATAA